jgi:putative transposase
MLPSFWSTLQHPIIALLQTFRQLLKSWTKPIIDTIPIGAVTDLTRRKSDLLLENTLLRHQLIVLRRQSKRPQLSWKDRLFMVLLASQLPTWRQILLIIQPDTVLRWHRDLFKHFWRNQSRHRGGHPPLSPEIIALIKQMATENRLWGAERIRGELRKLGWRVGKGTVLKYLRQVRPARPPSQTWKTFLQNHGDEIWACDFIQITDVWFRSLFVFIIIELGSRRVVQMDVTRHPTDAWVAQQLREATPFQQGPQYLIRDNDKKYGQHFAAVAAGTQIEVLRTPVRASKANAICERFLGSVRRECLDHLLILGERHLFQVMKAYIEYYNLYRPHQGLAQRIPTQLEAAPLPTQPRLVVAKPVLAGLHHHYSQVAA